MICPSHTASPLSAIAELQADLLQNNTQLVLSNQFMGIETSADHGGAECGFTSAIVVIEGTYMTDYSVLAATLKDELTIRMLLRFDNSYRTSQGRPFRIGTMRCTQHARQHSPAQIRHKGDSRQVPPRVSDIEGEQEVFTHQSDGQINDSLLYLL